MIWATHSRCVKLSSDLKWPIFISHDFSFALTSETENKRFRECDTEFVYLQGRIKKIMQSDEEVGKVAQAVPIIIYILFNNCERKTIAPHKLRMRKRGG